MVKLWRQMVKPSPRRVTPMARGRRCGRPRRRPHSRSSRTCIARSLRLRTRAAPQVSVTPVSFEPRRRVAPSPSVLEPSAPFASGFPGRQGCSPSRPLDVAPRPSMKQAPEFDPLCAACDHPVDRLWISWGNRAETSAKSALNLIPRNGGGLLSAPPPGPRDVLPAPAIPFPRPPASGARPPGPGQTGQRRRDRARKGPDRPTGFPAG